MSTVRPASAPAKPGRPSRRGFFAGLICGMWGIIAATLGVSASTYLVLPAKPETEEEWVDACDISGLTINQPVRAAFRRNRADAWKVVSEKLTAWVVKTKDQGLVAYGPQCTHLGCAYHWDENKDQFVCPCHNSVFSIDGRPVAGPAPRALDRYETKIVGSRLLIGGLRRSQTAPGQEPRA